MAPSEGVRGDSAHPQTARPQSQGSVPPPHHNLHIPPFPSQTDLAPSAIPKLSLLSLPCSGHLPRSRAHCVGSQVTSLGWSLAGSSPSCLHTALCLGPQLSSASPSPGPVSPEHETEGGYIPHSRKDLRQDKGPPPDRPSHQPFPQSLPPKPKSRGNGSPGASGGVQGSVRWARRPPPSPRVDLDNRGWGLEGWGDSRAPGVHRGPSQSGAGLEVGLVRPVGGLQGGER